MKARKIELKIVTLTDAAGAEQKFPYRDGLQMVLNNTGQGGISSEDVLKAVELKLELKNAADALLLQEPDYNWLLGKLNAIRWTVADESLAAFIKDVRAAPLVDLSEAENAATS